MIGLADLLWDTKIPNVVGDLNTFGGNGMGAAVAQSSKVLGAINKYDLANKSYEDMKKQRAAPRMVNAAKLRAQAAFKEMNQILHAKSLNYLNNNTFRMRQTTNAAGRTVWESIPVRDTADVQKLSRLAKVGRVAGPGFIVLDGYLRANDVHHSWKTTIPTESEKRLFRVVRLAWVWLRAWRSVLLLLSRLLGFLLESLPEVQRQLERIMRSRISRGRSMTGGDHD